MVDITFTDSVLFFMGTFLLLLAVCAMPKSKRAPLLMALLVAICAVPALAALTVVIIATICVGALAFVCWCAWQPVVAAKFIVNHTVRKK